MRPSLLDPLFAPATTITGIGDKLADLMAKIVPVDTTGRELRVGDLIFTLPHSLIDRTNRPGIALAPEGAIVTLEVRIDRHQPAPRGSKAPYRVFAHDETGEIALTFFHAKGDWLARQMPEGATVLVSGRMEWFNGRPSMVHPDHIVPIEQAADLPEIEPVYPLTAGLSPKTLRRAVSEAVSRIPDLPEWQDAAFMA
jgi:ATP-dependent DNA helicase RecG